MTFKDNDIDYLTSTMETITGIIMFMVFIYSIVFHIYLAPAMELSKVSTEKESSDHETNIAFIPSKKTTNPPFTCFQKLSFLLVIQSLFTSTTWPFFLLLFSILFYAFSIMHIPCYHSYLSGFYSLITKRTRVGHSQITSSLNFDISFFHSSVL